MAPQGSAVQELQPSHGCVLANSAAKTIPKPKRKSESKSELEPHLLPLSFTRWPTRTLPLMCKYEKPRSQRLKKHYQTLGQIHRRYLGAFTPVKCFQGFWHILTLMGLNYWFIPRNILNRKCQLSGVNLALWRRQAVFSSSGKTGWDPLRSSTAQLQAQAQMEPKWNNHLCFQVGYLHSAWLGRHSAVQDTPFFSYITPKHTCAPKVT